MISSHFTHEFKVSRLQESTSFGAESYLDIGSVKGFIQPVSGSLDVENGALIGSESHRLYTESETIIRAGDVITDVYGVRYRTTFSQEHGIAGKARHSEIALELI